MANNLNKEIKTVNQFDDWIDGYIKPSMANDIQAIKKRVKHDFPELCKEDRKDILKADLEYENLIIMKKMFDDALAIMNKYLSMVIE